jgi:para-nitrobenzyl esterase
VPADRDAIRAIPLARLVRAASDLVVEVQTAPDPARWGQLALSLLPFAPALDGVVLPQAPLPAIAAGQGSEVRLLIGSNRDEARLFFIAPGTIDLIDDATLQAVAGAYGLSADSLAVYRANRPGASAGDVLAAVVTDWFFAIPAIRVAEARAGRGSAGRGSAGTWAYRFDHPAPGDNHRLGACHGAEIPFVFDTITRADVRPRIGDTPSQAVADQAHKVWVDFITSGDPGWAAYDTTSRTTGLLADGISIVDDPAAGERTCWDGIR